MFERWEMYDERGSVTGSVLRVTPNGPASSGRPSRERQPESPLVDVICMILGFIMLAATVVLVWAMATAT